MPAPLRLLPAPLLLALGACPSPEAPADRPEPGFVALPPRVRHEASGIVLVRVPGGRATLGTPDSEARRDGDEDLHDVELAPFWLGETEVTLGQWRRVMGAESAPEGADDLPAAGVTWHAAQQFLERLNALGEGGFRLPTEDEWELACRAGTTTPFSFGETISTGLANYDGRRPYAGGEPGPYLDGPVPVRSYPPNAWGLYDMHGNLFEWCQEVYEAHPGLGAHPVESPGASRVIRGGSYSSRGEETRSGYRDGYPPRSSGTKYGFRVARSSRPRAR